LAGPSVGEDRAEASVSPNGQLIALVNESMF